jgi:hypothetical protein
MYAEQPFTQVGWAGRGKMSQISSVPVSKLLRHIITLDKQNSIHYIISGRSRCRSRLASGPRGLATSRPMRPLSTPWLHHTSPSGNCRTAFAFYRHFFLTVL